MVDRTTACRHHFLEGSFDGTECSILSRSLSVAEQSASDCSCPICPNHGELEPVAREVLCAGLAFGAFLGIGFLHGNWVVAKF